MTYEERQALKNAGIAIREAGEALQTVNMMLSNLHQRIEALEARPKRGRPRKQDNVEKTKAH